ncbi:MAG TPA: hypothetical protein VFC67_02330 [Prolixibacteraceae bacterium]|nr:hypothetical protein [Prolixibacteraceae bacterium]
MKKFLSLLAVVATPFVVCAQDGNSTEFDRKIFEICATIFVVGLFMIFILTIMKRILDHRLKNKILERGITDSVALSILQTNPNENRNINIKWFAILAGLGAGLTIVNFTRPLGIHSLAIMSFCIAVSFLGYFYFLKKAEK